MENFFNWFKTNMEWIFSGIGVLIITSAIGLINKTKSKQIRKLSIKTTFNQSWIQSMFGQSNVFPTFSFEITNIGNIEINIKDVQLNFCGKKITTPYGIADGLTEYDSSNPAKYRGQLAVGAYFKGDFHISAMLGTINGQLKPNNKIRLKVTDTFGNKYYSKKYKFRNFIENQELSGLVNNQKKTSDNLNSVY